MTLVDNLDLSQWEIEDGLEKEKKVTWHLTEICPSCGDRMFLDTCGWECRSNLYMEGGC